MRPKARPIRSTLSDFRAFHLKELSELFVQVVKLAREMRLVAEAQVDRRADQRLDQERAGVSAIQHARLAPRQSGVEARLPAMDAGSSPA